MDKAERRADNDITRSEDDTKKKNKNNTFFSKFQKKYRCKRGKR